jgi:hypothetical protein
VWSIRQNIGVALLAIVVLIQMFHCLNLSTETGYLTLALLWFSKFLQADSGLMPWVGPDCFFPFHCILHSHPAVWHCVIYAPEEALLNKPRIVWLTRDRLQLWHFVSTVMNVWVVEEKMGRFVGQVNKYRGGPRTIELGSWSVIPACPTTVSCVWLNSVWKALQKVTFRIDYP